MGGRLLVRRPVLFTALHVQPVVVGLLFPGAGLPVVMILKLALAHAVQEEPYRPAPVP